MRAFGLAIGGVFVMHLPACACILTALLPNVFVGIAAKTSAMFLSLPVKACLQEMSFFYLCQETPRGQGCTCTRRRGRGIGISWIKILIAKFPETNGEEHQPRSASHAERC